MRKVFGIVFYVLSGFFVYMLCLLSFINQPPMPKWSIVAGFTVPAILLLFGGLALNRFQNWRRHSGVVLLTAAGFTSFLIFTIWCLFLTDEFEQMMKPDTFHFFNAYVSGCSFVVTTGALGILLLRTGKNRAEPTTPPYSEPAARSPQG